MFSPVATYCCSRATNWIVSDTFVKSLLHLSIKGFFLGDLAHLGITLEKKALDKTEDVGVCLIM